MKFMRMGDPGAERPVVEAADGLVYDLTPLTADLDPAFLAADGFARARQALAAGELDPVEAGSLRTGAPLSRPGSLICIGMNYAEHAAESGAEPPAQPIIFYKSPNTVVGPFDEIMIPRGSAKTDWEVELGVVIGRRARYLQNEAEALACVAGYVVSNDVSERAFQLEQSGGQWSKGKSCETFNPLGPWIVPADEVDPGDLRLRSFVNGEPRQDSNTRDLIFDVPYLVHHLSQYLVLEPGDLINTGTPQGVALSGRFPYLKAGDVVEIEIDGLGRQRSRCIQA